MSLCGIGVRSNDNTINRPSLEVIAGASSRLAILEMSVYCVSGGAFTLGLGRPAAIGVTPTTPVLLQRFDPADTACLGKTAVSWGTGPTSPTFFMRRCTPASAAGSGVVWTWPLGLIVPVNGSVVIWNVTQTNPYDFNVTAEEG